MLLSILADTKNLLSVDTTTHLTLPKKIYKGTEFSFGISYLIELNTNYNPQNSLILPNFPYPTDILLECALSSVYNSSALELSYPIVYVLKGLNNIS